MSRLVLHYTDSTLLLLESAQETVVAQSFPLEPDKPFARERMSGPIKKALESHALQRVLWFSPHFTLFPRALFDPNQLEAYYQLNQGALPANQHLTYQIIAALDLVLIYSIPVWLYDYAKYDLHAPQVQHSVARQLLHLSALHPKDHVMLLLEATHFVLIAVKDSKLMCCTANEYQQNTDILYFLLAHQQKLQLPQHLELTLYDASEGFDFTAFEALLGQFKDFEHFNYTFYNTPTYQNQILCASSEDL
ncbi:MAG: hypothetical protein RIR94_1790 [Bacteroidota bacterium]|jgi:hypothetical protein